MVRRESASRDAEGDMGRYSQSEGGQWRRRKPARPRWSSSSSRQYRHRAAADGSAVKHDRVMDISRIDGAGPAKRKLAISRRSCDQCRIRKIGCDRGSPCSSCVSGRLDCTHSAVTSHAESPRQRVNISAQYEQKIDGIAQSVDVIKALLQELNVSHDAADRPKTLVKPPKTTACYGESSWDHSSHLIDFVKAVAQDIGSKTLNSEESDAFVSLKLLVQVLDKPHSSSDLSLLKVRAPEPRNAAPLPPLDAVLAVLRWAKEHEGYTRIAAISRILPLHYFTDACRKVYFAVDDYSEIDFILANGYLYYMFSQHVIDSGLREYEANSRLCHQNFQSSISGLPLLLPACIEVVGVLTLAAFSAIESSQATRAWTFVSAAADLCQRMGYHRLPPNRTEDQDQRVIEERLFWKVYKIEKGLSLRLGRASNIRDAEITAPHDQEEPRGTGLARIQGKIYDQLYSPVGLSRPHPEGVRLAEALAGELRSLVHTTRAEIEVCSDKSITRDWDPMRIIYLKCDLVCQYACLTLVLRAIPNTIGFMGVVSDECTAVARRALELHQQCIADILATGNDASEVTKYINCAIMHGPFVPFNIIFTHAVGNRDTADLECLDRFAASLRPETTSSESITHPYRLYQLLCQVARLYFDLNQPSTSTGPPVNSCPPYVDSDLEFVQFGPDVAVGPTEYSEMFSPQTYSLSDWYQGNQQIMSLFEEDLML